jgi:maltose alpha-D-glucosyltransferase / alpha-amylase
MADTAVGRELYPELRRALPPQLAGFLMRQRWFGGKARTIRSAELADVLPIAAGDAQVFLLVVAVKYAEGPEESYAVRFHSVAPKQHRRLRPSNAARGVIWP